MTGCFDEKPFYGEIKRYPDPHICCLSTYAAATSVPQWGLYGRNGAGIALVFSGRELQKKTDVDLVKVVYDRAVQRKLIIRALRVGLDACVRGRQSAVRYGARSQELITRIFAHVFGCIAAMYAAVMKSPEFRFEQEWRLSLSDVEFAQSEETDRRDDRFDVTTTGSIIKPFFKCMIEPSDLVEILVGPTHHERNVPAIRAVLRYMGYTSGNDQRVPVRVAKVSLRA